MTLDQLTVIAKYAKNLELNERKCGIRSKSFWKEFRTQEPEITALVKSSKIDEWINVMADMRHQAAHKVIKIPAEVVAATEESEKSDDQILEIIKQKKTDLDRAMPEAFLKILEPMMISEWRLKKMKRIAPSMVYIQDKNGRGYMWDPVISVDHNLAILTGLVDAFIVGLFRESNSMAQTMSTNRIDRRRGRLMLRQLSSMVSLHVSDIEELSLLTEQALKKEYKSILASADREIADDLSESDKSFIAECYAEDFIKVEKDFPRILRYSLFTTVMSKIEGDIGLLCRGTKNIFSISQAFSTKAPNVVDRGIKYLRKYAGISTDKYKHYIELIDNFRRIRNCIVHSGGRVSRRGHDQPLIHKFVEEIPTLELDHSGRLILLEGFVDVSIHSAQLLMNRLLDSIRKRIDRPTSD